MAAWLLIFKNLGNLSNVCFPFLLACTCTPASLTTLHVKFLYKTNSYFRAYLHRLCFVICIIFRYHYFKVKHHLGHHLSLDRKLVMIPLHWDVIPAKVKSILEHLQRMAIYSKSQPNSLGWAQFCFLFF